MSANCEICGTLNPDKKNRFCRKHEKTVLRKLDREGYLEPLEVTTVSGHFRLSNRRFLTLQDESGDRNQ